MIVRTQHFNDRPGAALVITEDANVQGSKFPRRVILDKAEARELAHWLIDNLDKIDRNAAEVTR